MEWVLVSPLRETRAEFDATFPNRDKTTDGAVGNQAHAVTTSSHNPDETGNAEHKDHDGKNEVRAIDVDKDLRDPSGVTMEDVVQLLVKLCRLGYFPWIRYIIYNKRIWHRRDGFATRVYKGSNDHSQHLHLNSEFNQQADETTGVKIGLASLKKKPAPSPAPTPPGSLVVDGKLGPKTISKWQTVMGTHVDGRIDDRRSELVYAVQKRLKRVAPSLVVDGTLGPRSIEALQRYLRAPITRKLDVKTVKALQRRLNTGQF